MNRENPLHPASRFSAAGFVYSASLEPSIPLIKVRSSSLWDFPSQNLTTKTWERFPSEGLKNWGAETASSYQLVNFRDKMLIAKALGLRKPNAVLKVYVPG